ncbi:lytic polysaccharide monooxygenase [Streptomyces sp. JJ36]|uniref:lytic polysaccharide monooxygenase auxiliary activity family 9 protein n=1 Tax=Streptomyces sp. JJ36 TaxID=2736645 RepID=UPI001F30F466|nr:lytic polysaccharide monooxygenase [Streptomyces sp. JJ36]MCF6522489.1 lytic polysaccharide monooxygenase [Streptomyces sp. JJ36]
MTARRTAASVAAFGLTPLALSLVTAAPAAAHGSMSDPVSRVSACFAEGPENPRSAACKAAIAAGGTQAFYDWNEVNLANADGRHREIVPDGELCSAGREKYRGLDLPRADWPATAMTSGKHTFRYRATAPHRGGFALYLTKEGYDPAKPLKWSDLEEKPFATVQDPKLAGGHYVFEGTVPERSGRHLVYSIWQRSDSPEAFYTCSDVVFGGEASAPGSGGAAEGSGPSAGSASGTDDAPPAAPSEEQIAAGAERSTVDHGGHGGDTHDAGNAGDAGESAHAAHGGRGEQGGTPGAGDPGAAGDATGSATQEAAGAGAARPQGAGTEAVDLAETGGDGTGVLAAGGAAALAAGAGLLFALRRRTLRRRRA